MGTRLGDILCMSGIWLDEVLTGIKEMDTGECECTGLVDKLGTTWFGDGGLGLTFGDCRLGLTFGESGLCLTFGDGGLGLTNTVSVLPSLLTASWASSSSLLGSVRIDVWVLNLRNVSRNPEKQKTV